MFNIRQSILSKSEQTALRTRLADWRSNIYTQDYSTNGYVNERNDFLSKIPSFLKEIVDSYLSDANSDGLIIKNCPLDIDLGLTPIDVSTLSKDTEISEHLLLMIATQLGTPFAIDRENNGFMIHNIFPVRQLARNQCSKSSEITLTMHTELSCINTPPDFLILLGMREADYTVNTPIAKLDELLSYLTESEISLLHEPIFTTEIDESLRGDTSSTTLTKPFAILSRPNGQNEWRFDVEYTRGTTPESQRIIQKIIDIHSTLFHNVVIRPGDLVIINNTKVAHAREPFKAKYDGSDRWLQRVNVHRGNTQKTFYKADMLNE